MKNKLYAMLIGSIFCILTILLYNRQVIQGNSLLSESIILNVNTSSIENHRGLILDRKGRILAKNKEVFDITIIPYDEKKCDEAFIDENIQSLKGLIKYNQDYCSLESVEKHILKEVESLGNLAKLDISAKLVREYVYPHQLSHVIGYVGPVQKEHVQVLNYVPTDMVGKYKIELDYEEYLKPIKGVTIENGNSTVEVDGTSGKNIYLNLDLDWQLKIYELLEKYSNESGAYGGAGVVLNSSNNDVMALVSFPGFDTNKLVKGINSSELTALQNDNKKPLLDKAIGQPATPGSVFKIVSAYALLSEGAVSADSTYFSNRCIKLGIADFCEFGKNFYGQMNLEEAIYKSSNLYFCYYALNYSREGGIENIINIANLLKLGKLTNIDIGGESDGTVDNPDYKLAIHKDSWFDGDTCNMIIGQGANLVTPLQMANVMSILHNYGKINPPKVINKIVNKDLSKVEVGNDNTNEEFYKLNKEHIDNIFKGMSSVAYNPQSSVYWFLKDLPNNVKAKTGSAETVEKVGNSFVEHTHSWIVGSFEYEGEIYTFCFFLQFGGGGYYLAPIVRDFITYLNSL